MDNKIISVLHKLVALTGIAFDEMAWEPIQEGGNNRLLKLKIDTAQFILKQYFISREENWDRLKNESLFLGYAQSCGTGVVPKLIWVDALNHFAVHEYIDGKKINPSDLDDDSIEQAISFIEVINQAQFRKTEKAKALSQASDACLSRAIHVKSIQKRLDRLMALAPCDALDKEAHGFVTKRLSPAFTNSMKSVELSNSETVLERSGQIISPSDFGFHNAIQRDDKRIFFIDFEYAGWDDPVKMICDFFCQPEIQVKEKYLKKVVNRFSRIVGEKSLEADVENLLPLYRIKWCCIILNVFDPLIKDRKRFASFDIDYREQQLTKAKDYFKEHYHGLC